MDYKLGIVTNGYALYLLPTTSSNDFFFLKSGTIVCLQFLSSMMGAVRRVGFSYVLYMILSCCLRLAAA